MFKWYKKCREAKAKAREEKLQATKAALEVQRYTGPPITFMYLCAQCGELFWGITDPGGGFLRNKGRSPTYKEDATLDIAMTSFLWASERPKHVLHKCNERAHGVAKLIGACFGPPENTDAIQ